MFLYVHFVFLPEKQRKSLYKDLRAGGQIVIRLRQCELKTSSNFSCSPPVW
jgi:hypothetical protein